MSNHIKWPELPYTEFKSTAHLLHMLTQAIGKLKLATPFEPHWANVPLWVTTQGLTSGIIPHHDENYSIEINFFQHQVICYTSNGKNANFKLTSNSVAEITKNLFNTLASVGINVSVNLMPQEVTNPIPFNEDLELRNYDEKLAFAWWRILLSSYNVFQKYHAKFSGATPDIGLMWGTFDLRDARYINRPIPTTGANAGYLRRNAMDVAQVEAGWWSGDERYEKPAFYSFIYPQPENIAKADIMPTTAYWNSQLGEFILDYDELRKADNPDAELLIFLESTYHVEASLAHWDEKLIVPGVPI